MHTINKELKLDRNQINHFPEVIPQNRIQNRLKADFERPKGLRFPKGIGQLQVA